MSILVDAPVDSAVSRRRTFAIIAHPDAGKTTLTEKLLLFGGAIQLAGMVKARGERRRARSDWMKVEQERGISVASSVMTFDYNDITFKHILLPVWLSSYRYKDKVYRFLVNARTGEVQGERPYSAAKIAALVITVIVIIGAIIYFSQKQKGG